MKRQLLSVLLCLAMVAKCLPTAALAAAPQKAIELDVTQLKGGQTSSIYFGNYQQNDATGQTKEPVKWRVLANNENANGSLFLLADQNLDVQPNHTEHADVTWENSYLRAWLNSTFMNAAFSNGEQQAIKTTYIYNKTQSDGVTNPNPEYSTAGGNNTTDRIFLPSIEEMNNSSYFPAGNDSRISTNTAYVANKEGMHGKVGKADYWWLRSPGWKVKTAAYIQMIGAVWTKGGDINASHFAIRPAFNIDLNTVLFASAAVGGKGKAGMDGELTAIDAAAGSNEWKLTLLDSNRHFDVAETAAIAKPGGTVTLSYTGASSGTNEYISAIIADGSGAQYYGRIMRATDEAGTVAINIPKALADGEYTLQVFSEQYNGGENDDTKRTDYASAFASVALTVTSDTTAPTLSYVSTSRTDMAKASVRFSSDEAGSYYYAVVESGADEPTIDTSGAGISCDAAEHDILLENLADAGAKDIYIVAKDAAGNVSNKLKITIPAYHIYTLHVTAPPFETVYDSDPQPDAKPITIQSVGNTDATIETVSVSGDAFTISGGGNTVEAGKTIDTWTIQPKAGLSAGTHTATITVTYNNGMTATAPVSIVVVPGAPAQGEGYTIDYTTEKIEIQAGYEVNQSKDFNGNQVVNNAGVTPGQTLFIRKAETATTPAGAAVAITVPERPAAPTVSGENESIEGRKNGKITGVSAAMEYKKAESQQWIACSGETITALTPGQYQVRLKATNSSFAGVPADVEIAVGVVSTYTLNIAAPTFEKVISGYTQPDAKPITIQSVGNTDATIETVSVSGDAFTISGGGNTVEAGKTIDTWTIQPKAGLSAGTHTATITVTYNNGMTATAEISFTVEATYRLTVVLDGGDGKDGSGSYVAGTQVALDAGSRPHYRFAGWTTSDGGTFTDASASATTFTMPSKDVTVKANWIYCGSGGSSGTHSYTIKATAGANGMISPSDTVKVRKGSHQTFTITPHNGYTVSDVMVDGQSIGAVTTYTFENVKKSHTIEAFFEKAADHSQGDRFEDVVSGCYYEEAVKWAVQNSITSGTDATHFSPDAICTRAQAVVFLWRISGSPKATDATMPFSDVPADSYYYDAVLWGVENGLVKGTGATQFSPQMHCSRAQIVTFLWRVMDAPQAGSQNPFTDVKDDAYYYDAVLWAVKDGVTKGTTDTTFSPKADCTRAQIVVFLWRMFA